MVPRKQNTKGAAAASLNLLLYEILDLVAMKCDPKTLAIASCVSKSWSSSLSSDHLWRFICTAHFPSLSNLHPSISYRRIYSLGHSSATRRHQPPPKPRLSLHNLLFAVTIPTNESIITILKPFAELENNPEGRFRFDLDMNNKCLIDEVEDNDMKISCNIVTRGYESVFKVLDKKGRSCRSDWWFTEELPSAGCCFSNGGASGLLAELILILGETVMMSGKKKKVVEKVRVGVMNVTSTWRYAGVEDTLRYATALYGSAYIANITRLAIILPKGNDLLET